MSRILAIHTTAQGCHVALSTGDSIATHSAPQASSALPGLAIETARASGSPLSSLDALAIACGPGSFTGIKIGLASAWGLARPARLRVLGVGSLDALAAAGRIALAQGAANADGTGSGQVDPAAGAWIAIAGAYAGFVYGARFRCGADPADVELEGEYRVGRPAELIAELTAAGTARVALEATALGEVAAAAIGEARLEVVRVPSDAGLAAAVLRVARVRDAKGLRQEPRALYLRADPAKAW